MERFKKVLRSVGVEPVMFLYMMAYMTTSVVEESFYLYKTCTVDYGIAKNICDHINAKENAFYKDKVHKSVSEFYQWYNMVSKGIPILLSFFLGAWSDRVGRKIPLILGLVANLIYSVMIVVNSMQDTWRLHLVLWTAALPCALGGGNLTVFMASFSYLADTTTPQNRTLRTTLLEVAYLIPMPLGVALGNYLFKGPLYHSYTLMFTVNASLLLASVIYAALFLKTRTAPPGGHRTTGCWCGVLNWTFIVDSLETLFKKRPQNRRTYLLLVIAAMAFYTFQRDESHMMYLYVQHEFFWDFTQYSNFRTLQSSFYVSGLLIGVPVMVRYFKLRDTVTIIIGSICHISARIVYTTAKVGYLMYLGAVLAILGPIVAPVLRSLTSKLVPASERGKAFAALSIADSSAPVLSGVVYSQVYMKYLNTFPASIFLITISSQIVVLLIALYITYSLKGSPVTQAEEEPNSDVFGQDSATSLSNSK